MSAVVDKSLAELCTFEKGTYPALKTPPGEFPLVVTAERRRTADSWQLEGPAVCIPLVSSTGHGDAAIHRIHYQEGRFALSNLLVALKPRDSTALDARYLYYLLTAQKESVLVPLMVGTANVSLKEADVGNVRIPVPVREEQQRVVHQIAAITARLQEVRRLKAEAKARAIDIQIALAHRSDMDDSSKMAAGWSRHRLGDVMQLVQEPCRVSAACSYPNVGIYSFGRGLFRKPDIVGLETSARTLYQIRAGQFVYSRLFAFEGAYGIVAREFDSCFVSNEYPTFGCDQSVVDVEFLGAYFLAPSVWGTIAAGSKGLGDRRQRVQPARILDHELWIPPIRYQKSLALVVARARSILSVAENSVSELASVESSVLASIFKGTSTTSVGRETPEVQLSHEEYFSRRCAIACYIVSQLHRSPTFGRTQLMKGLYMAEAYAGVDLRGSYERHAAGPFDRSIYDVEDSAQRQEWFTVREGRIGRGHKKVSYTPLKNINAKITEAIGILGAAQDKFDRVLALFAHRATQEVEILATLYAAWNDLILAGSRISDDAVVREARDNWHEAKKQIPEQRWRKQLHWMRKEGLVPSGIGRSTYGAR
jgi:hypothetical protein